jgi:hypothetical protein
MKEYSAHVSGVSYRGRSLCLAPDSLAQNLQKTQCWLMRAIKASPGSEYVEIRNPLLICFEEDGRTLVHIHPSEFTPTHEQFGIVICDLVCHVALNFCVPESAVWEWVDKERFNPTDEVTGPVMDGNIDVFIRN